MRLAQYLDVFPRPFRSIAHSSLIIQHDLSVLPVSYSSHTYITRLQLSFATGSEKKVEVGASLSGVELMQVIAAYGLVWRCSSISAQRSVAFSDLIALWIGPMKGQRGLRVYCPRRGR
jgi:hypothetical protein